MDIGNERVAHMLMAEVAPLQDDRTEALPQPSSFFLLAAQQRDALAVFPHAGQGIAEFGLRLVHTFGDHDEAPRHQDDRRAGDDRVKDRRDHQVAGDDDGCRPRAERQIAPTIQSTPTNVTAVTAALKMPTTKSTGASVAIRASSPM